MFFHRVGSKSLWLTVASAVVLLLVGLVWLSEADLNPVAFAVAPDGKQVVFAAADGDLYLLSLETSKVVSLGKTEAVESSPNFAPDGQSIVYSSKSKDKLSKGTCLFVRSLDGKTLQQLTNDPAVADSSPSFSRDGREVVFARAYRHRPYSMGGWTWDDYDICLIRRDGTNLRRLTTNRFYQAHSPGFTADGEVVFAGSGDYPDNLMYLFAVAPDGSRKPERVTSPPPNAGEPKFAVWGSDPSVAADGRQLTWISDRLQPYHYDIWISDAGGANPRTLNVTPTSRYNSHPVFLPNNKGIMYLSWEAQATDQKASRALWTVPFDGGKPVQIGDTRLFSDPLGWSPPVEAAPASKP